MVCILVVLLLPMPTWMLDFSLALSITFSVVILMTVLFVRTPLELNTFPTILLVATMLRLALNLASTRLILANGYKGTDAAGRVIQAFGNFVVGGNYIIGLIVFAILVIVNFVVITKGAGRIAEVGARFSLDAMPGKQMAIDADLSAGLINEEQARERRSKLEEENSFYGSMDGASKFVRGDAIAGLLITFINIIGGIIIGIVQQDMKLAQAVQTYTLLTVGDGLVTQVPALIVSIAAGMLVTKTSNKAASEQTVLTQLGAYPIALGLGTVMLLSTAALPGIPALPFLMLAGLTGGFAYSTYRRQSQAEVDKRDAQAAEKAAVPVAEEPIASALQMDSIRLELGYGLLSLINNPQERRLTDQIKALRRQLAIEMGFVMPAVRIQDNLQLPPNQYVIRIKEIEAGTGELRPNLLLVMDPRGEPITLSGQATTEPTFGLPAMWIQDRFREEAMFRGYTVVDAPTVVTTHLTELIRDNMAELLSYAETQKLLDDLDKPQQKLVADLIPGHMSLGGVHAYPAEPPLGARLDPRSADDPRGHLGGRRLHAQPDPDHRACARPSGAPAFRRRRQCQRHRPADHPLAGMGAGLCRIHRRPGRGTAACHGAEQTPAIHRRRPQQLREAGDARRDARASGKPGHSPLRPLGRRAVPAGYRGDVAERNSPEGQDQDAGSNLGKRSDSTCALRHYKPQRWSKP